MCAKSSIRGIPQANKQASKPTAAPTEEFSFPRRVQVSTPKTDMSSMSVLANLHPPWAAFAGEFVSASGASKTGAAGQLERGWNERELTKVGQRKGGAASMFGSNGPRLTKVSQDLPHGRPCGRSWETFVNRGPFEPNMLAAPPFLCPTFVNSRSFQPRSSWPAAPVFEAPLAETNSPAKAAQGGCRFAKTDMLDMSVFGVETCTRRGNENSSVGAAVGLLACLFACGIPRIELFAHMQP